MVYEHSVFKAIGWTLVHSVWQISVIIITEGHHDLMGRVPLNETLLKNHHFLHQVKG